jgi:SAM-dependent MidA family methyltransferase
MLEPSPELRERQRARLGERVRWLDTLPQRLPRRHRRQRGGRRAAGGTLHIDDGEPRRLGVRCDEAAGFAWTLHAAGPGLRRCDPRARDRARPRIPRGLSLEFCPMLQAWVRSLAESLEAGLLLIVDYGLPRRELYAPERVDGTLICHYRHRAHGDPFLWPGLQDLSAWVDFTAIAEAGTAAGLALEGYTTQAAFLSGNGLHEMLGALAHDAAGIRAAQQAKRLLLPGEMGERFRVMGLSRELGPALAGFGLLDLANRL